MRVKITLLLLLLSISLFAEDMKVKMTVRRTTQGPRAVAPENYEETMYVHDGRARLEVPSNVFFGRPGPALPMAAISDCDTGHIEQIDPEGREYRAFKRPEIPSREQFEQMLTRDRKMMEKYLKSNTIDTGETRDFHGQIAKHFITTITNKKHSSVYEKIIDGWYIDSPWPVCGPDYMRSNRAIKHRFVGLSLMNEDHPEKLNLVSADLYDILEPTFILQWFTPAGFPVYEKSTVHQIRIGSGEKRPFEIVTVSEVIEFSRELVDPSLFEIPAGFRKVGELYKHQDKKHQKH